VANKPDLRATGAKITVRAEVHLKEVWSDGRPLAVALSHDVDRLSKRWQHLFYVSRALLRRRAAELVGHWRSLLAQLRGDDPYWDFPRIMALEEELGVRSTFFFLRDTGKRRLISPSSQILFRGRHSLDNPKVKTTIRLLDTVGWEICLHGSYHSYCDLNLLRREKNKLESILGHRVLGARQHYLNLDIPETWQLQAELGLAYDSTLGYSDRVGHRWGVCRPFFPRDPLNGERLPILQIPLSIMDGPLMRQPQPWDTALHFIEEVQAAGGVLTLDWHQRVFNPWEFKETMEMYARIIVECQRRGAWVTRLVDVAEHWQEATSVPRR
jgi:peptidoglycan/xylan/chitin deacetylase (PgdA/CDA1 family)